MATISVIIPAYNCAASVTRCVESVLAQTYTDLEVLLVDDGSTDETPALCDALAAKDHRVRVIHQVNGGVSKARNAGLAAAQGEIIAFVDADDYLVPEAYATMVAAKEDAGAKTVLCNYIGELPDGKLIPYGKPIPAGHYDPAGAMDLIVKPILCGRLEGAFNGFIWCYLFDRALLEEAAITFSGIFLEDELFLLAYFCHGSDVVVVEPALYRYVQNPESVTRSYMKDFETVFTQSMKAKLQLVERYQIKVPPVWKFSTLWFGLLTAVGNVFAHGNPQTQKERIAQVRYLAEESFFAQAVRVYKPRGMNRRKALVAKLLRARQYRLLGWLYQKKNR